MPRLLASLLLLMLALPTAAKDVKLDTWIDRELIPYVTSQLLTHPRFKGETVTFVVMDDSAPAPLSNELALSLRDRLLDAALDSSGVRIGWRQGTARQLSAAPVDCTQDDVHYQIGLELKQKIDASFEINVRALDLEERSWVGGFGKTWRGGLTRSQHRAFNKSQQDETFLGSRNVPFDVAQTDLLARHLAHEMSCNLLRQTNGEYVVPLVATENVDDNEGSELDATIELVSHNIAQHSAIEITTDNDRVNAELVAKAHQIDGPLHQYWLTMTPNGNDENLTALSVSAYVMLGDSRLARDTSSREPPVVVSERSRPGHTLSRPAVVSIPNAADDGIIGPLRILTPVSTTACRSAQGLLRTASYWSHEERCSLLQAATHADAVVFFLEHQPHLGLVRLGGADCRDRTTAKLARRGAPLSFPVAWFRQQSGQVRETTEWQLNPAVDTYYAIAITDERLARRLANHIDTLPIRCGAASKPGLAGHALSDWLDKLASLAAQSAGQFDWRALQLKDVY